MGDESSKERLDREFIELLTELRVLLRACRSCSRSC
jgi:hypothetical protein